MFPCINRNNCFKLCFYFKMMQIFYNKIPTKLIPRPDTRVDIQAEKTRSIYIYSL